MAGALARAALLAAGAALAAVAVQLDAEAAWPGAGRSGPAPADGRASLLAVGGGAMGGHVDRSSEASGVEAVMDEISSEQRQSSGVLVDEVGAEQAAGLAGPGYVLDEVGSLQLNEDVGGNDLDGLLPASRSAAQAGEADVSRPAGGVSDGRALPGGLGVALLDTEALQVGVWGGAVDKSAAAEKGLAADRAQSLVQVDTSRAVDRATADSRAEHGAETGAGEGSAAAEGGGVFTGNHVVVDEVGMENDDFGSGEADPAGGTPGPGAAP